MVPELILSLLPLRASRLCSEPQLCEEDWISPHPSSSPKGTQRIRLVLKEMFVRVCNFYMTLLTIEHEHGPHVDAVAGVAWA